jgi:hypothetical protein
MPVAIWRDLVEHYYPQSAWVALHRDTLDALQAEKRRRGLPTPGECLAAMLEEQSS